MCTIFSEEVLAEVQRTVASSRAPSLGNETSSSSGVGDARNGNGIHTSLWLGNPDYDKLPWWQKPSIYWLLPAVFMSALVAGGLIAPRLNIILSLICREHLAARGSLDLSIFQPEPAFLNSDNPQCRVLEVQSRLTKFNLYTILITGILSFFMTDKMLDLSDRYGRIKFLVIPSLGSLMVEFVIILAANYPDMISYQWILLGSVFDGICGSITAGMMITHAYAIDCTPPPKKAIAIGYFQACIFSGIALGPLLAAYVSNMFGTLISVFYVAVGTQAFFIFFLLLSVPESLSEKQRLLLCELNRAVGLDPISDVGISFSQNIMTSITTFICNINPIPPYGVIWRTKTKTSTHVRTNLVVLSSIDTIVVNVVKSSITVAIFYNRFQFGWGFADIAIFISMINFFRIFALDTLLPLFSYLFRTQQHSKPRREPGSFPIDPNPFIVRLAFFVQNIISPIYVTACTGPVFIFGGLLISLGGVGSPTLGAALTKHVPYEKVEQLLKAMGLLHAQARFGMPIITDFIHAEMVDMFPQAEFVSLTACVGNAFHFTWVLNGNMLLEQNSPNSDPRENKD
ncbi:hypothetical protein B7494_g5764 [Chlorociboria aeruginascens]|nr:hypothetical protein B7494_g5764 [Chlorociboria aeruginascens]